MGFKNWFKSKPIWVKGGFIGAVISLVMIFYPWVYLSIECSKPICPFQVFNVGGANCVSFLDCHPADFLFLPVMIFLIIFILVLFSLFGAAIGWIYGKIRHSKHN